MRPRIRTLKPEIWQDEKIGALSRDARLLLVGLVTMADDEGRIRALPASIIGHIFPYDRGASRKLRSWLDEVLATGIVTEYVHESVPYLAFRHWNRHQRINRPTPSLLPAPPEHAGNRRDPHDALTERSLTTHPLIGSDQDLTPLCPPEDTMTNTHRKQRRRRPTLIASDGSNLGEFERAAIARLELTGGDAA